MVALHSAERVHGTCTKLNYEIRHSQPGRDGTTLTADLEMVLTPDRTTLRINLAECDGQTPQEALDRLAHWLERLAVGIKERGEVMMPV